MVYLNEQGSFEKTPDESGWITELANIINQGRMTDISKTQAETAKLSTILQGMQIPLSMDLTKSALELSMAELRGDFEPTQEEKNKVFSLLNDPELLSELNSALNTDNEEGAKQWMLDYKNRFRDLYSIDVDQVVPDESSLIRISQYGYTDSDLSPLWEKIKEDKKREWARNKKPTYSQTDFTIVSKKLENLFNGLSGVLNGK